MLNDYLDDIIDKIDMGAIKRAGLRVALDPMYGVSVLPLKTLLLTSRCDVETIHDSHDTLFGGKMPAPSAGTLRQVIARFSGTEPLLRIFCEMSSRDEAIRVCEIYEQFLAL